MAPGPGTFVALLNLQECVESSHALLEALDGRSTCVKVVWADAFRDQVLQATQDLATARAALHTALLASRAVAQQQQQQRGLGRGPSRDVIGRALDAVRPSVVRQYSTPVTLDQCGFPDSPVGGLIGLAKSRFGSETRVF